MSTNQDRETVDGLLARIRNNLAQKRAFIDPQTMQGGIGMGGMGGMGGGQGGMPMDPAMMGGQGGMPPPGMDPSMMMGGGMPMDPPMMQGGGMPMDPSMMGGAPPPGGQPASPPAPGQQGTGESGGDSLIPAMNQGAQAAQAAGVQVKQDQNIINMQLVRMMSWLVARVGEMSGQQFDPMLMTVMPGEIASLPQQAPKAKSAPAGDAGGGGGAISPIAPISPAFGGGGDMGTPKQATVRSVRADALALAAVIARAKG